MNLLTAITRRHRINRASKEIRGINADMLRDIGIDQADISRVAETLIDARVGSARVRKSRIMLAAGRAPA